MYMESITHHPLIKLTLGSYNHSSLNYV